MKKFIKIFVFIFVLFFVFFFDLNSGDTKFSVFDLLGGSLSAVSRTILTEFRLPRVMTAIVVGISLSVSGLLLQTLFNNSLSGPYIFGISSGASLGVALLLLGLDFVGVSAFPGTFSLAIAGMLGSLTVLFVVLLISLKIADSLTILIIGIFLGTGIGAFVNLMQYFSDAHTLKKFVVWTMGSLDSVTNSQLYFILSVIFISLFFAVIFSKFFDTLYLGEVNAMTTGVNVKLLRLLIFFITGTMTGVVTAFCGPIGFIGIAVPHLARLLFKTTRHLSLLFYSALLGSIVMMLSDGISHSFSTHIIPINTVVAFIGIPVIIWVVVRNKRF